MRRTAAETTHSAATIEQAGQQATQWFTKLRNEAIALFGLFVGATGIRDFISQQTALGVGMGITSQQIGIQVEQLGEWIEAGKRFNIASGTIVSNLSGFRNAIETMRAFGPTASPLFPLLQSLGVNVLDAETGKVRDPNQILIDISRQLQARHYNFPEAQMFTGQLGLGGITPLLMQGPEKLQQQLEQMRQQGVPTDEFVRSANELNGKWLDLSQTATTLGRAIFVDLEPYLGDAMSTMEGWATAARAWVETNMPGEIEKIAAGLKGIDWQGTGAVVKEFATQANNVVQALGGWKEVSEALVAIWIGEKFLAAMRLPAVQLGLAIIAASKLKEMLESISLSLEKLIFGEARALAAARLRQLGPSPTDEQVEWALHGAPETPMPPGPSTWEQGTGLVGRLLHWFTAGSTVRAPGGPAAGMQANNPLNLMFAGQPTATGQMPLSGGRNLAVFPDMATGIAAEISQLQRYQEQGLLSVRQLVTRWVSDPSADLTSYIADVSQALGVSADAPINMRDPNVAAAFVRAAQQHESGPSHPSETDLLEGARRATQAPIQPPAAPTMPRQRAPTAIPGAPAIPAPPAPPPLQPGVPLPGGRFWAEPPLASLLAGARVAAMSSGSTATTNINGPIIVHTAATDAEGIARGISSALRKYSFVPAIDTGLV